MVSISFLFFRAECPTSMSFMLFLIHVWSEKREFNSSLVVAENEIQPAEIQSILVPGHHRNGQEPDHV